MNYYSLRYGKFVLLHEVLVVLLGVVPLLLRVDRPELLVKTLEVEAEVLYLLEDDLESFHDGIELVLPEHDDLLVLHIGILLALLALFVPLCRTVIHLILIVGRGCLASVGVVGLHVDLHGLLHWYVVVRGHPELGAAYCAYIG